jgi:hypothetical protein
MMQAQGHRIKWPAGYLPSAPAPSATTDVCACCQRNVETPFHHENKYPRTDGYDYCADCNNAGCGDPDDHCLLTESKETKVAEYQTTVTDRAQLEMQLRFGVGADGGNLSDEERGQIETRIAEMDKADEMALRTVGDTTTPEPDTLGALRQEALNVAAQHDPEIARQIAGDVTVEETGEQISFAEAAGRVHGLPPEQIAELERLRQQASEPEQPQYEPGGGLVQPGPRPHLTGNPPTGVSMGPASPPLNPPMTAEDAVEAVMEVLQEVQDQTVVHQLFLGLLGALDPRDSDVSLAMLQWLQENGRVHKMGTLDQPLSGYIYFYNEPKGTTKEGYTPGGTQGGRMVDKAAEQVKASGVAPAKKGMCPKCMRLVREEPDGSIVAEIDDTADCVGGATHELT